MAVMRLEGLLSLKPHKKSRAPQAKTCEALYPVDGDYYFMRNIWPSFSRWP